ncbi:hypothetical protein ABT117_32995 [Streptomyces sp. NPDC002262]|uniref:hypothetical protein n=1 Tax=Streptomyces sp. NPDC002262 TaxID=3154414 RepID=UPI0033171D5F
MDAIEMRLRLTADYLQRESSVAIEELMAEAFDAVPAPKASAGQLDRRGEGASLPPPGGDPRSARLNSEREIRRGRFRSELQTLLDRERREEMEGHALRRIAELIELFEGEGKGQEWWHKAALKGDVLAIMMLADE